MMRFKYVLPVLLSLAVSASAGESLVPLLAEIAPSVGALYIQRNDGSLDFSCTVTAVDKHDAEVVLLTAHHCVSKDVAYLISFDGKRFYAASVWKIPHDQVDGNAYPRRFGEPATDMALFLAKVEGEVPSVPFSDAEVPIGTRIVTMQFPLGVTKVGYEGLIAGRMSRPGSEKDGYLILQTFGAPGSSGAAVITTESKEVIGVLVSGVGGETGLPVIFATPATYRKYLCDVSTPAESEACKRQEDKPE